MRKLGISALVVAAGVPGMALAALPAGVDTALASVQADAVALQAIVVPIVVAILGLGLVLRLIKKFGNKAV